MVSLLMRSMILLKVLLPSLLVTCLCLLSVADSMFPEETVSAWQIQAQLVNVNMLL